MSANQNSAEDAQDEFASGGDYFDDDFNGGGAGGEDDGSDSAEDAQDEFASGGGGFDDDDDDTGLDQTPSFGGGAAGGNDPAGQDRGEETPQNSGRSNDPTTDTSDPDGTDPSNTGREDPSSDEVPTFDGRQTRLAGEDAPGNTTGGTTATVLDEAGDEGQRVTEEGDDPLVVDDGRGLEDRGIGGVPTARGVEREASSPAQQAREDAVERLQSQVDREVPGVNAIDTEAYNVVPAEGGGLRVELTDQGVQQVREATAADGTQASRGGVRTAEQAGRTPVDPALRDDPRSGEAAADAVASGGLTAPIPVGQSGAGEAASDLVGSGTVAAPGEVVSFPFANAQLRRAAARGRTDARSASRSGQQSRDTRGSGGGSPVLGVPIAAAREIDQAFAPDRAPDQRTRDPGAEAVQDAVPLPDERELAADLQALTGLPSERELTEQTNTAAEGAVGFRPRETAERERVQARDATLTVAAQAAERAQERPLAALAAGAPVAAAEPTPLAEAALLGGAAAGVIGVDLAGRIRERRDAPAQPGVTEREIVVPAEEQRQREVEVPADGEVVEEEIVAPDDPAVTDAEIGVGQGEPFASSELQTPRQPQDRDPLAIRTAELIGRQEGRQAQRDDRRREQRRDESVPERFLPDEEVTIGREQVEQPEVDSGRRFPNADRPDFGVRVPGQEARESTEVDVGRPSDRVEQVPADTVAGVGANAGLLFPPVGRERARVGDGVLDIVDGGFADAVAQGAAVAPDEALVQQPGQTDRLVEDQRQRQRQDQRQREAVTERQGQAFAQPSASADQFPALRLRVRQRQRDVQQRRRRRRRRPFDLDDEESTSNRDSRVQSLGGDPSASPEPLQPNAISELVAAFSGAGAAGRRGVRDDQRTLADETVGLPVDAQDTAAFRETSSLLGFGAESGDLTEDRREDDENQRGLLDYRGGLL